MIHCEKQMYVCVLASMNGNHQASPLSAENHWDNYKAIHIQTLSGSLTVGIRQLWDKLIAI